MLAFLATGGGGERFVLSSEIVERFAAHFDVEVTLGGTGVRAGIALDRIGVPTVQHLVSIDDNIRRLLPPSMRVVSSATRDTLDPHLIVQYPQGAVVRLEGGEVVAPASNRLIFANDAPNREMAIAADLGEALAEASAFLVSGFNTMQDAALLDRRLQDVRAAMRRLPPSALVYYEDAGFYERSFAGLVRTRLMERIDVYGMNEDELQEYLGRPLDLLSPDDVVAALAEAHALIPAPALVVHTKYWAVAVGSEAARHRAALESATRTAATRYRLGDACRADDLDDAPHVILNFITPHQKWGIHSTYTDNLLMLTLSRGGPIVWMSEVDAAKAGLVDNDWVETFNSNGALVARVVVSQRMKEGTLFMYHAQEKITNMPGSPLTGQRGGIHNSVTRAVLKPTHMIGGYVQLAYGFNYYGTVGSNRDEYVIVRKLTKVDWLEGALAEGETAA